VPDLLIATGDGIRRLGDGGTSPPGSVQLSGQEVTGLASQGPALWAIVGDQDLWRSADGTAWQHEASAEALRANCVSAGPSGVLVGTSEAHVLRFEDGALRILPSFDGVAGRTAWYTPWGGPPDSRSISQDPSGATYVNVHVGGIVRSGDGGATWEPTIDIHADVHQVLARQDRPGGILAATARGLAISEDSAETWKFATEGLHATYLRAVAVSGEHVLVSASTGPRGGRAAVYRLSPGDTGFERCSTGLPEWFSGNIDTFCLTGSDGAAAFASPDGSVYLSQDEGATWELVVEGLPSVRAAIFA
jgi:hypothetical protein